MSGGKHILPNSNAVDRQYRPGHPRRQRVMFVNNDTRAHDVVGGIDPGNPECPEIVQAGFLVPGQRGETGVFTSARTCNYHDHTALGVPALSGRIIIR